MEKKELLFFRRKEFFTWDTHVPWHKRILSIKSEITFRFYYGIDSSSNGSHSEPAKLYIKLSSSFKTSFKRNEENSTFLNVNYVLKERLHRTLPLGRLDLVRLISQNYTSTCKPLGILILLYFIVPEFSEFFKGTILPIKLTAVLEML